MHKLLVTFWSPVIGHSGTSSNILATAVVKAISERSKILLINGCLDNSLEYALLGDDAGELLNDIGVDALLRLSKMGKIDEENIKNTSISFLGDRLHFIPRSLKCRDEFDENMRDGFAKILTLVDKYYDYIFVDLPSGTDESGSSIINISDLLVVNLPQNKRIIDYYFKKDKKDNLDIIYILGNYNPNSSYNIKNLMKIIPKLNKKTVPISTNIRYSDAISDSKVIEFLQKKMMLKDKQDKTLIKEIEKLSNLISIYANGGVKCLE